jgi:hypothetical protein
MNRIWKYLNEEKPGEEQPVARDYWVVRCETMWYCVRPPQAARIQAVLARRWQPRWLEFRDIAGSRIRIRTAEVLGLQECTAAQRANDRRQARFLTREEENDGKAWDSC